MHDGLCSQDGDQVPADIGVGRQKISHMIRQPWGSLGDWGSSYFG